MKLGWLEIKVNLNGNSQLTVDKADKRYKQVAVCDEIHKSVDDRLSCVPLIKDTLARVETKVDILLKNGK